MMVYKTKEVKDAMIGIHNTPTRFYTFDKIEEASVTMVHKVVSDIKSNPDWTDYYFDLCERYTAEVIYKTLEFAQSNESEEIIETLEFALEAISDENAYYIDCLDSDDFDSEDSDMNKVIG